MSKRCIAMPIFQMTYLRKFEATIDQENGAHEDA